EEQRRKDMSNEQSLWSKADGLVYDRARINETITMLIKAKEEHMHRTHEKSGETQEKALSEELLP
ncbi:MAG TPA: hypothetical protein PK609_03815, partial [Candidatus Paceibacterota bacterium]|nr:hypothetical protein [Candidatus Paceibacterota bacterium]